MPPTSRFQLDFSKGLLQNYSESVVPNGYLLDCQNWVPCPFGGVEARPGWSTGGTGISSPDIIGMAQQEEWGQFVVADVAPFAANFYAAPSMPSNFTAISGGSISGTFTEFFQMAMGQHTLGIGGPELLKLYGVQNDGTFVNSGANAVPQYVWALAYHHSAWYAGGGKNTAGVDAPATLFYTDPGDGITGAWPAINFIDIGAGGRINALATYQDDLIIGKNDSLWLLRGTPQSQLDLHELDRGAALGGNSIVATPYGAIIASKRGLLIYDGATVKPFSRPIQGAYFPSGSPADLAYFDNKLFAALDGLYVYDFERGTWYTESIAANPTRLAVVRDIGQETVVAGGNINGAVVTYRTHPEPASQDEDFTEVFTLLTPEYWVDSTEAPAIFRTLHLKLKQLGGDGSMPGLTVTPFVRDTEGVLQELDATTIDARDPGVFRERVNIPGVTGYAIQFRFDQTVGSADHTMFDIESAILNYQPTPPRE
jgi:hypothetical protein